MFSLNRWPKTGLSTLLLATWLGAATAVHGADLEKELGRNEVRVRSAPYPLRAGLTVWDAALLDRLEQAGYRRVHERPDDPGEFFFGHDRFWIYRRDHRWNGKNYAPSLIGLALRRKDGMILAAAGTDDRIHPLDRDGLLWLEPETLAESLPGDRASRVLLEFETLPEHVWRPVLAAEDARFFDHAGVDARAVARAALANVKKGGVAQGGSTITQQLIKNRDLSPKRSLGRKASEAVRALLMEAEYDKREILQAYLNQLYLGHVDGLAIHGIGTAARVYFSKPAGGLTLAEAATLAAMIQGPNRLSPLRHESRLLERRDWVLGRLEELEWVGPGAAAAARRSGLGIRLTSPRNEAPAQFLDWVSAEVGDRAPERLEHGRGVVVETTLDPWLQRRAEQVVAEQLERIRRRSPRLGRAPLNAALIALDARNGDVLAYVGGDPAVSDGLDRARKALRQPGSTVKPFVMLEAFDRCGARTPLHPASRVEDEPLRIELPSGAWEPDNVDGRFRGVVTARTALARSLNVPTVRIARWCGWPATAQTFDRLGLKQPADPPPSFVLGSVETTPLDLARAYTVVATPGALLEPRPVSRIEKPAGKLLARVRPRERKVARPASAWLVRSLMVSAVEEGTAKVVRIDGVEVAAKTGSTSGLRDAWLAGHAGSVLTLVWVGLDDGADLGLGGAAAAGPIWVEFMRSAVGARPPSELRRPRKVVERHVDPKTGLLVRERNRRAEPELFRRGALPPRDRFWRSDDSVPVVR